MCFTLPLSAQNTLRAVVRDRLSMLPLPGADVYIDSLSVGAVSDINGLALIPNIPDGLSSVKFSYMGYRTLELKMSFNAESSRSDTTVLLEPEILENASVIVTSTRSNGVVSDIPVHVEVLGLEEVREESGIKPGNVSKLLGETSGVQVHQTSLASGSMGFSIQGLPDRYARFLKDGFPVNGGLSSGLSLLQVPPLDLLQVEVIRGATSVLYGGDAISGIVNLISRRPSDQPEWNVLLNGTQEEGRDFSTWFSGRKNKLGMTLLATGSTQKAVDSDKDGFSDVPRFSQYTVNPVLFYDFNSLSSLRFSLSASNDKRRGGDMTAMQNGPDSLHPFLETNHVARLASQAEYHLTLDSGSSLSLRNSFSAYKRDYHSMNMAYSGTQVLNYSDLYRQFSPGDHDLILGADLSSDAFSGDAGNSPDAGPADYFQRKIGAYVQDTWSLKSWLVPQIGLRVDRNAEFGTFVLPRISMLLKQSSQLQARIGYGSGYSLPTPFSVSAGDEGNRSLIAIPDGLKAERSQGLNLDVSWKITSGEFGFSLDQAFFYTNISDGLVPEQVSGDIYTIVNSRDQLINRGLDTNLKLSLDELVLFADYSRIDIRNQKGEKEYTGSPVPEDKLNLTLTYEEEGKWSTGIEAFYTGKQRLDDLTVTQEYWTLGVMIRKDFGPFILTGNVENLTDVKQSDFGPLMTGSVTEPEFAAIYAPTDGRVANIALEIKLR